MDTNKRKPLGYIKIPTKRELIPVVVMNDVLNNYIYEKKENWEMLRSIINIFKQEYRNTYSNHCILPKLIQGGIVVTTQYKHLKNPNYQPMSQDFQILSENQQDFAEMQISIATKKPIQIRALEYLGLSLGHSSGMLINQIWLLGDNLDELLHGNAFEFFTFKGNVTGNPYPDSSGIMFVNLPKLSEKDNEAGQLAKFLLGIDFKPTDENILKIKESYTGQFAEFVEDKGVSETMSFRERWESEGEARGEARGEAKGEINKAIEAALEMLNDDLSLEVIAKYVKMPVDWVENLKSKQNL